MRIVLALLGLAVLGMGEPASATVTQYQVRGVKAGDSLSVRAAPSSKARVVGRIPANGREIEIIARGRGSWVKVGYGRVRGFVNRRYLAVSKTRAAAAPAPAALAPAEPSAPVALPEKPAAAPPPQTALPGQGPEDRSETPDLMKPPAELMPETVPATPPG